MTLPFPVAGDFLLAFVFIAFSMCVHSVRVFTKKKSSLNPLLLPGARPSPVAVATSPRGGAAGAGPGSSGATAAAAAAAALMSPSSLGPTGPGLEPVHLPPTGPGLIRTGEAMRDVLTGYACPEHAYMFPQSVEIKG